MLSFSTFIKPTNDAQPQQRRNSLWFSLWLALSLFLSVTHLASLTLSSPSRSRSLTLTAWKTVSFSSSVARGKFSTLLASLKLLRLREAATSWSVQTEWKWKWKMENCKQCKTVKLKTVENESSRKTLFCLPFLYVISLFVFVFLFFFVQLFFLFFLLRFSLVYVVFRFWSARRIWLRQVCQTEFEIRAKKCGTHFVFLPMLKVSTLQPANGNSIRPSLLELYSITCRRLSRTITVFHRSNWLIVRAENPMMQRAVANQTQVWSLFNLSSGKFVA